MFGLLSDIKQFFSQVADLIWWLALGGGIAFLAALFRSWLGYAGVAVGGAAIMFVAITSGWLGDDSEENARLKAQLKAANAQLEISRNTTLALQKSYMDEALASEHNEGSLVRLRKIIDALGSKPECGVSKDFTDALKDIR